MSLRMLQTLSTAQPGEAALNLLDVELAAEKAVNLGRLGRTVETTLAALATTGDAGPEHRETLVLAASAAVWRYFVQREMCGALDHREAIVLYGIPPEVLARLGSAR
ncbi:MAG: DUF6665 family protein [Caulobacteraceae bacterium]